MTGSGDTPDPSLRDTSGSFADTTPNAAARARVFDGLQRPRPQPLFLARSRYRHRRLRDVARLMPVLAALVWLFPLLWRGDDGTGGRTASAAVFVFLGWAALIVAAWALSRRIDLSDPAGPEPPDPAA